MYTVTLTCIVFLQPSRPPPPVIPYSRHQEGKKRLAQSLRLQTTSSLPEVPVGMLLSFTPPETPRYDVPKNPFRAHQH